MSPFPACAHSESAGGEQNPVVARLRVVAGQAQPAEVELRAASACALVVGSSALCGWRVHARGVRARHLRLRWTGRALRVDEVCGPGAVLVDGRPIAHRLELPRYADLQFGSAKIELRSLF